MNEGRSSQSHPSTFFLEIFLHIQNGMIIILNGIAKAIVTLTFSQISPSKSRFIIHDIRQIISSRVRLFNFTFIKFDIR